MKNLSFVAPPFNPGDHKPEVKFVWWSWHPNYPYWSKSCWQGSTEAEAWDAIAKPFAVKMRDYHNKLIREGDGSFTEVYDLPPQFRAWRDKRSTAAKRRYLKNSCASERR